MEIISKSEKQTKKIASDLAKNLVGQNIICLYGELGAGKTTFVSGFAKGLGIKKRILSPTFVIIRQYLIPKSEKVLFHIDLYRLQNSQEIDGLGIGELLSDPKNIVVVEWAEKLESLLPKRRIEVKFKVEDDFRKIQISRN
jgi:tRNA threonylcarbamoyladenosine biosynthesis protein TsaE